MFRPKRYKIRFLDDSGGRVWPCKDNWGSRTQKDLWIGGMQIREQGFWILV